MGVIVKKHLIIAAFITALAAPAAHANGAGAPAMDAEIVSKDVTDASDSSGEDVQIMMAMLTLGVLITLGIAN